MTIDSVKRLHDGPAVAWRAVVSVSLDDHRWRTCCVSTGRLASIADALAEGLSLAAHQT